MMQCPVSCNWNDSLSIQLRSAEWYFRGQKEEPLSVILANRLEITPEVTTYYSAGQKLVNNAFEEHLDELKGVFPLGSSSYPP